MNKMSNKQSIVTSVIEAEMQFNEFVKIFIYVKMTNSAAKGEKKNSWNYNAISASVFIWWFARLNVMLL